MEVVVGMAGRGGGSVGEGVGRLKDGSVVKKRGSGLKSLSMRRGVNGRGAEALFGGVARVNGGIGGNWEVEQVGV